MALTDHDTADGWDEARAECQRLGMTFIPGMEFSFGALVTNCDIPRDQVKGLSSWRHGSRTAALNVSAGVGTSIYAPVRFACAPEASLVTLTARES